MSPPRPPIRTLIADDHAVVREGLKAILAEEPDIQVVGEAGDGVEVLERTAALQPDVVVLDVHMPRGGGLEALHALRCDRPGMAILMLSFQPEEVFGLPFLREGAHGYLEKTNVAESLADAVRQVHRGRRYVTGKVADRLARGLDRWRPVPPLERLSAQELVVLSLLAAGRTPQQIAAELLLSRRTVNRCCGRIVQKTGLPNAASAIQQVVGRAAPAASSAQRAL